MIDGWIEWPTEPGWYWFVGLNNYHMPGDDPVLKPVKAQVVRNGAILCHSGGEFMYETEWKGAFIPAILPDTKGLIP